MSGYKTDQRRVVHRGREFHFVSYEGHSADPAKDRSAVPATWFLMSAGKRWEVGPQIAGQETADLQARLVQWLDEHIFGPGPKKHRY